ncbi:serine/threonine-protein kinase 4-like [Cololabis saira]|uniref:serine/threonine-protein kinase 4-like n=1 Tax=Cololabis saira TaxID=129043 RepID=UPI002AD4A5C6|nr:serine/threonine-protein kinase 4-like [Cololabis saira]XP_061581220.1 serine/threonine-protein kinase 4-like [Cololabis saira]XP_061581221.1 serine/threonine-protein kinase 4-like [Cololabis saira]
MGSEQSTLAKEGFVISKEAENYVVATKGDDTFFIKKIHGQQGMVQSSQYATPRHQGKLTTAPLTSEIQILKTIRHPHIVNIKETLQDGNINYVMMDYCQGGNLASKIKETTQDSLQESEVLSWIVEICMALKIIHEKGLLHKNLIPEKVFLTGCGILCLGGFGKIHETSTTNSNEAINYLPPEVFTKGTYDSKSDIWSLGCILYELCTKKPAFSAETPIRLMPRIIGGHCPTLPEDFSPELCQFLIDMLQKEPHERPSANEILERPFILCALSTKCITTVKELQAKLKALRDLADGLERVHEGTTIGSLAGGVIGAAGGITSIVGLILAPFTLGASLIVTGVGVGVGALGGLTAGVSNITNMVNQSTDRKAVHSIIKEFEQKISAVVTWLQEISYSLQTISSRYPQTCEGDGNFREENLRRLGLRAGRGLSGVTELIRLARVVNIGRIAAQASRTVRVAEVATGILSGLFIAVDIFFIAMDAKEIHNMKQDRAAKQRGATSSSSVSDTDDSVSISEITGSSTSLLQESNTAEHTQNQSSPKKAQMKTEIMKFILSVREAADSLEKVLVDLESIIAQIPLFPEEILE